MQVGAAVTPVDVSTTGSSSGYVPQPVTTAPIDWRSAPSVQGTEQAWGGFFVGLGLGLTPGGAMADQVLSATRVTARGTQQAQVGKALGEMSTISIKRSPSKAETNHRVPEHAPFFVYGLYRLRLPS